jgi:alanyl-tRNA synthetase
VGDTGYISAASEFWDSSAESREQIQIIDTLKENGQTVHITTKLPVNLKAAFNAVVESGARISTAANHSATHLLNEALREVLGGHVEQKGSLVGPIGLRFDFSHFQKVTPEELRVVERRVNAAIRANHPLDEDRACSIDRARENGAMMLFGEKYGDRVRVIRFGDSVELCGGTHVAATGAIGLFKIISEGAISAGVRRIEAVTGVQAENLAYAAEDTLAAIRETVKNPRVQEAVAKMFAENEALVKEVAAMHREKIDQIATRIIAGIEEKTAAGGMVIVRKRFDMKPELVRGLMQVLRGKFEGRLVMVAGIEHEGRPTLAITLGDAIVAKGVNAGAVVREAAKEIDGNGGGQPFFAMAGGKNVDGLERAMDKAIELIKK